MKVVSRRPEPRTISVPPAPSQKAFEAQLLNPSNLAPPRPPPDLPEARLPLQSFCRCADAAALTLGREESAALDRTSLDDRARRAGRRRSDDQRQPDEPSTD